MRQCRSRRPHPLCAGAVAPPPRRRPRPAPTRRARTFPPPRPAAAMPGRNGTERTLADSRDGRPAPDRQGKAPRDGAAASPARIVVGVMAAALRFRFPPRRKVVSPGGGVSGPDLAGGASCGLACGSDHAALSRRPDGALVYECLPKMPRPVLADGPNSTQNAHKCRQSREMAFAWRQLQFPTAGSSVWRRMIVSAVRKLHFFRECMVI